MGHIPEQLRTSRELRRASVVGHSTSGRANNRASHVRVAPKADEPLHRSELTRSAKSRHRAELFDYFVGSDEKADWRGHTKGPSRFEIDGGFVLRRSLDRQIGTFGTAKDLIDV